MKSWRLLVSGAVLSVLIVVAISPSLISKPCKEFYRADKLIKFGGSTINTEVAQTEAQKEKGLSGKSCINNDQGMLFTFKRSGYYSFWMKNMNFPIDMVWIDVNQRVVTIKANILPSSYPKTFVSSAPAKYVLELKAGQAKKLELENNTQLDF